MARYQFVSTSRMLLTEFSWSLSGHWALTGKVTLEEVEGPNCLFLHPHESLQRAYVSFQHARAGIYGIRLGPKFGT